MLLAVDLGNGWTKAMGNGRSFMQPSVVGTSAVLFEGLTSHRGVSVWDETNREFFIGNLAIDQSDIKFFTISDNKPQERITGLLLEGAIAALVSESRSVTLELVTGLPVDHFATQREALRRRVESTGRIRAMVDGRRVDLMTSVVGHRTVPQPFGTAADLVLDDAGEIVNRDLAAQSLLVVDVGFHTVDLLALRQLQIVQSSSKSVPYGLAVAYGALSKQMNGIPLWEVDRRVLHGSVPHVAQALAHLAEAINAEVASLNQEFDVYLITGGGGAAMFGLLLPGRNKILADAPAMANVRGYLKLGARAWRRAIS